MQVWVESFEGNIYMVKTGDFAPGDWLRDRQGKPRVFHSPEAARQHFAHQKVRQAWLIQHSPYGEMVGLVEDNVEPAAIPLYWNTNDV